MKRCRNDPALFFRHAGKRTGNGEYSCLGGGAHVGSLVGNEYPAVFPAIKHGFVPKATDRGRGAALPFPGKGRRPEGPEYSHRAESPAGGTHYEEVLMRKETSYGGQSVRFCPRIITIM